MRKTVICIPSANRLNGSTFTLLKDIPNHLVYIYTSQEEHAAYAEQYPQYHVIAHSITKTPAERAIGAIRLFIQGDQHLRGNHVVMMDDDLSGFKTIDQKNVSLRRVFDDMVSAFSAGYLSVDILTWDTNHPNQTCDYSAFRLCGASWILGIGYGLYTTKVRFDPTAYTEDIDFFLRVRCERIKRLRLPYYAESLWNGYDGYDSHFDYEYRTRGLVQLYARYGKAFRPCRHRNEQRLYYIPDEQAMKRYIKSGKPEYNALCNIALDEALEDKIPGWEMIQDWENRPRSPAQKEAE